MSTTTDNNVKPEMDNNQKAEKSKIFEKPKLFDVYASYIFGAILLVVSFLIFFVAFSSMSNEAVFQNIGFLRVCHGVLIFIGVVTSVSVVLGFVFAHPSLKTKRQIIVMSSIFIVFMFICMIILAIFIFFLINSSEHHTSNFSFNNILHMTIMYAFSSSAKKTNLNEPKVEMNTDVAMCFITFFFFIFYELYTISLGMMIGRKNMFKYVLYMNGFVLLVCAGAIFGLFLLSQFAVYFSRSFSLSFIFFFIGIFLLFLAVFYLLSVVRMKQTMVALRILAFVLLAYTVLVIISFSIFIALLSTIENEYFISTFLTLCPIDVGGCMGDGCPFSPRHIPNAQTRLGCYKSFYETAGILNCSKDEIVMYGQTGVRCSTETILEKALETAKEDTLFIFKINSGACFASVINCAFTAHIILLFLYPSYMNFSKMSFCGLMDYIKRKSGADAAALAADKDLEALEHEDEDEYDSDEEEFMEKNAVKEKRALREEAENLRHIKNLLGYLGTSREDDDVYIKEPLEGITYHRPEVRVAAEHRRLMERQHAQQQQQLELQLTQQKKARLIAHKLSVHANASSSDEAKNTRAGGKLLAVSGSGQGQVRTGRAAKAKGTHRTKVADGAEGEGVADDNDEEIVEEDVKKKTKAKKGAVKKKKKGKTATMVHTGREDDASPSGAGASVSASGTSASPTAAPAHEHAHAHAHAHAHGHAHPHKSKTLQSPTHKTKPADGTKPG